MLNTPVYYHLPQGTISLDDDEDVEAEKTRVQNVGHSYAMIRDTVALLITKSMEDDEDDWLLLPTPYGRIHDLMEKNSEFYRDFLRAIEHGKPRLIKKRRNDPSEVELQRKAALRSAFHRIWGFQFPLPPILIANGQEVAEFITKRAEKADRGYNPSRGFHRSNGYFKPHPYSYADRMLPQNQQGRNRPRLLPAGSGSGEGLDGRRGPRVREFGGVEPETWQADFGGDRFVERPNREFHIDPAPETSSSNVPLFNGHTALADPASSTRTHTQEASGSPRMNENGNATASAAPSRAPPALAVPVEDSQDVLVKIYDPKGQRKTYKVKSGRISSKAFSKVAKVYADNLRLDPGDISFRAGTRNGEEVDLMNFGGTLDRELILHAVVVNNRSFGGQPSPAGTTEADDAMVDSATGPEGGSASSSQQQQPMLAAGGF